MEEIVAQAVEDRAPRPLWVLRWLVVEAEQLAALLPRQVVGVGAHGVGTLPEAAPRVPLCAHLARQFRVQQLFRNLRRPFRDPQRSFR